MKYITARQQAKPLAAQWSVLLPKLAELHPSFQAAA
jgi:hypothetical protein